MNPEIIRAGAVIAGELVAAIIEAFARGEDLEPLVSALPPEAQGRARRVLEREDTRRALEQARRDVLGDED